MKDWIEKILSFLGDVIKFISPVLTFLLGIFYERMKLKKKSKNSEQIIYAKLTYFLATFISYSLKCYMFMFFRIISGLYWDISKMSKLESQRESIKDNPSYRSRIEAIEKGIKDLKEKIGELVISIPNNKKSIDERFNWIFALSKKYEKSFPKEIVEEIKDLQESIEDFCGKLEEFHKGLIDGEFVKHFWKKYRSVKPEIEDIYFDVEFSKSIIQTLTDLEDFDNELIKEVINILSEMARLSSKKSKYSYPYLCSDFIKEIKPLILKIDEILEKERARMSTF